MLNHRVSFVACTIGLLALAPFGCSGNDKSSGKGPDAGASGGAGTGGAGTGGSTVATGGAATGGAAQGSGGTASGCDESPCSGKQFAGQALPTCCQSSSACGVSIAGQCVDPALLAGIPDGGFTFGQPETVVLDPTCPGRSIMGLDLKGCCDKSSVCGVSTEGIAASVGFPIPTMCITAAEASSQFGQSFPGDGGAAKPCHYPADAGAGASGSTDAGRD